MDLGVPLRVCIQLFDWKYVLSDCRSQMESICIDGVCTYLFMYCCYLGAFGAINCSLVSRGFCLIRAAKDIRKLVSYAFKTPTGS